MNIHANSIKEKHKLIHGTVATKEDMAFYRRFQSLFGITDNDGLWPVVIAMQGFSQKFYSVPDKLATEADKFIAQVKNRADAAVQGQALALERKLIATMDAKVKEIARDTHESAIAESERTGRFRLFLSSILCGGMLCLGTYLGYGHGHTAGLAESANTKIAAEWGATEAGQKAYKLFVNGSLERLLKCSAPGWQVEKQTAGAVCMPLESAGVQHGWLLPE